MCAQINQSDELRQIYSKPELLGFKFNCTDLGQEHTLCIFLDHSVESSVHGTRKISSYHLPNISCVQRSVLLSVRDQHFCTAGNSQTVPVNTIGMFSANIEICISENDIRNTTYYKPKLHL